MIPISDGGLRRRRLPVANLLFMAIMLAVFIYELTLTDRGLGRLIYAYGVIPREIITGRDLPPPGPPVLWLTLLTSMFIHGGWLHLGSNLLYLWVFGDNVEDALGSLRYISLYLASGVIAGLAQVLVTPGAAVPSIGASGAIAGVLAAYLVLFPRARVQALVFLGLFVWVVPVPALVLIGLWAIMQFFSGVASLGVPVAQTGGVAYWAHIGGFVGGLLLVALLRKRTR